MDTCHVLQQWSSSLSRKEIKDLIKEKEKYFCCLKSINAGKHINKRQTYTGIDPKQRYTDLSERILPYLAKLYDTDSLATEVALKQALVVVAEESRVCIKPELPKKEFTINGSEEVNSSYIEVPAREVPIEGRIPADLVLFWYSSQLKQLDIDVTDFTTSWRSGLALWGLISMCEEGYLDMADFKEDKPILNNQRALGILSHFFGVTPILTAEEISTSSAKDEPAMIEYLSSVLLRIKRTYTEVMPVPLDVSMVGGPSEDLKRESEDLLGGLMRACYSAVKWKQRIKHLNRSGSLPSVVPCSMPDNVCTVCKAEIFCRDNGLYQMGHAVHRNCFKCSCCDVDLTNSKYVFNTLDKKYYCSGCQNEPDLDKATVRLPEIQFSSASPIEPVEEYARRWFEEHKTGCDSKPAGKTNVDVQVDRLLPRSESRVTGDSKASSKLTQMIEANLRSMPRKGNVAAIIKKFGALKLRKQLFSPNKSKEEPVKPLPVHKSVEY